MAECAFVSTAPRSTFRLRATCPNRARSSPNRSPQGPCTDQPENDQARDDDQKPDTPDIPSGDPNAKPLEGNYTATVTDGGQRAPEGSTKPVVFTPCGPGCTRMAMPPGTADLHLQGTTWSGTYSLEGVGTCTFTVDANTLDTTEQCPSFDLNVRYALTKNG